MNTYGDILTGQDNALKQARIQSRRPRRARVAATVQHSAARAQRAQQMYQRSSRRRQQLVVTCFLVITVLLMTVGLLLVQKAQVMDLKYANSRLEREIRQIDIDNRIRQAAIVRNTDLRTIQNQVDEMGFAYLTQDQFIHTARPVMDQMILGQSSQNAVRAAAVEAENRDAEAQKVVESWYGNKK